MNRSLETSTLSNRVPGRQSEDAITAYLLEVHAGKTGLLPTLLRGVLSLLAPVYVFGLEVYLLPYRFGLRRRHRLPCPVICVGNLTTGGTGKTPMTQWLCRSLLAQGTRVAILSRGYGGENEYGAAVVSDGKRLLLNARQAGDEAYLLACTLPGVPVVVGKERRTTGRLAWERFRPDVLVLDDGMQFWQLHKDLEIALLNAARPFDNGWTLPRGLLREPPSHLARARAVVLTNMRLANATQVAEARSRVAEIAPDSLVVGADLIPVSLHSVKTYIDSTSDLSDTCSLAWLVGKQVVAISGLGNPESFETMLVGLGCDLVESIRLRDHRAVTEELLHEICQSATLSGADAVLTTEKDAVKMPAFMCSVPVYALRVEMRVEPEADFMAVVTAIQREFVASSGLDRDISKRRG